MLNIKDINISIGHICPIENIYFFYIFNILNTYFKLQYNM